MTHTVSYLLGVGVKPDRISSEEYPFNLSLIRSLDLRFTCPVTFCVGENGTGKSTVMILQNRIRRGLFLFDEPEAALSPQRQLVLLAHMAALVASGSSQFIIATHSPILLTFPGAEILSFDGDAVRSVSLGETSHYQITRGILQNPAAYWKHLQTEEQNGPSVDASRPSPRARRRR